MTVSTTCAAVLGGTDGGGDCTKYDNDGDRLCFHTCDTYLT